MDLSASRAPLWSVGCVSSSSSTFRVRASVRSSRMWRRRDPRLWYPADQKQPESYVRIRKRPGDIFFPATE
jgi:hypothetical protein